MVKFLLFFTLTYFLAYWMIRVISKKWIIFNYINCKTKRRIISILVIFTLFGLINSIHISKNVSDIFLGLSMGCMISLLQKIKYTE